MRARGGGGGVICTGPTIGTTITTITTITTTITITATITITITTTTTTIDNMHHNMNNIRIRHNPAQSRTGGSGGERQGLL